MNDAGLKERFLAKILIDERTGCWIWTAHCHPNGYGQILVGRRAQRAHRVSFELHCGPIPQGMHILHRCDVTKCVNPDHLFLGTNNDNVADKISKGRHAHREKHGAAKLTEEDVLAIRSVTGRSQTKIAKDFGVSQQLISDIRLGKRWSIA